MKKLGSFKPRGQRSWSGPVALVGEIRNRLGYQGNYGGGWAFWRFGVLAFGILGVWQAGSGRTAAYIRSRFSFYVKN